MASAGSLPVAQAGLAAETFRLGGAGGAIVQLLLIASVGKLSQYFAGAFKQGQIADMISLLTVLGCIGVIIDVVWKLLSQIATVFGFQL